MQTIVRRTTTGAMAFAVALGLALGAVGFTPDGADARARVPSGGDSHQRGCYSLQSGAQDLVDEYADEDTTDARREEILGQLRNIGSDWRAIGCQERYGNILMELPDDSRPVFDRWVVISKTSTYTVGAYR